MKNILLTFKYQLFLLSIFFSISSISMTDKEVNNFINKHSTTTFLYYEMLRDVSNHCAGYYDAMAEPVSNEGIEKKAKLIFSSIRDDYINLTAIIDSKIPKARQLPMDSRLFQTTQEIFNFYTFILASTDNEKIMETMANACDGVMQSSQAFLD